MSWFDRFKGHSKREELYDDAYDEEDEDDVGECLSVDDAALIWGCSGQDEDCTFGYSEEELEKELY